MRGVFLWMFLLCVHTEDAMLTISPNWSPLYVGGQVSFECNINKEDGKSWFYKLNKGNVEIFSYRSGNSFLLSPIDKSDSGDYQCVGKHHRTTLVSNIVTLTVKDQPQVEIKADNSNIPVGGHVTLTCSINPPSEWTYQLWYKENKNSGIHFKAVTMENENVLVSRKGFYRCNGYRGDNSYVTQRSNQVQVDQIVSDKAVVTLQPNWPQLYIGQSLMVRCEISGENSEWEYEWKTPSRIKQPNSREFRIHQASLDNKGDYQCKGRMRRDQLSVTEWSDVLTIRIIGKTPVPVLTVSPSWLSPSASLTLSCDVDQPSAGWKFYWYKEIRTISDTFNRFDILPISINGTNSATITINEPTQTARYVCRAGRGDPIVYTHYSSTKFVWSADDHHSVSLKVSPGQVQHFVSESVVLTCEGNVTNSRVMLFTDDGFLYRCSLWGAVDGPVCKVTDTQSVNAVFWCESELGFSNAVNITRKNIDIILVSPVHPVTEGQSVTISCKLSTGHAHSNVSFYKDDKLVQSERRAEMTISTVSESDEGFYKCQHFGKESPQSWMSVKTVVTAEHSSPHPVLLIIGLVFGVLVIILLLLLLYCYKASKGVFFTRSNNKSSAAENPVTHTSVAQGATSDVTYTSINLQNLKRKTQKTQAEENTIYSDVKFGSSAGQSPPEEVQSLYSTIQTRNKFR